MALDGGADGLDVIRALLERLPRVLRADGVALLEIGSDQAERIVAEVADRAPGWTTEVLPDLAGLPRVARLEPPQPAPPASRCRPRGSRSGCSRSTSTGR